MALTRKFLKALGLEDDKIDEIISAHSESVDALKEQRDQYKEAADKLPGVQKELDAAKEAATTGDKDSYKVKYDALKEDFDAYKNEITARETTAAKRDAYRALLKECGVSDKRLDAVLKVADLDSIELADGKIKDADKLTETVKNEWADFIVTEGVTGAKVETPPTGGSGVDTSKMTDAEYFSYQREQKKG